MYGSLMVVILPMPETWLCCALLVMGFISLVDKIEFMLISSRHICIRSMRKILGLFSGCVQEKYENIVAVDSRPREDRPAVVETEPLYVSTFGRTMASVLAAKLKKVLTFSCSKISGLK